MLDVLEPGDKVRLRLTSLGHLGYSFDDLHTFLTKFYQRAKPDYDDDSCNGSFYIEKKKRTPKGHWGFNMGCFVTYILDLAKRIIDNPPEGVEITVDDIILEGQDLRGSGKKLYTGSLRPHEKTMDKLIEDITLRREMLRTE